MTSICNIPNEILRMILYLTDECEIVVSHVCHLWRAIVPVSKTDCSQLAKYSPSLIFWAINMGYEYDSSAYLVAVQNDNIHTLIWLMGYRSTFISKSINLKPLIKQAIKNRNGDILKFLMQGAKYDDHVTVAMQYAKLGMIISLQKLGNRYGGHHYISHNEVAISAVKHDQVAVVKYLLSLEITLPLRIDVWIRSIEMAKVCLQHNPELFTSHLYIGATTAGNLDMIKWLRGDNTIIDDKNSNTSIGQPCPWYASIMVMAVRANNIEIVKYLRSDIHGEDIVPWKNAMDVAAKNSHYNLIKYMRDGNHKCNWSEVSINSVVGQADLEFIKWLIDDDCGYDLIYYAIKFGQIDVLKLLVSTKKPEQHHLEFALKLGDSRIIEAILQSI